MRNNPLVLLKGRCVKWGVKMAIVRGVIDLYEDISSMNELEQILAFVYFGVAFVAFIIFLVVFL